MVQNWRLDQAIGAGALVGVVSFAVSAVVMSMLQSIVQALYVCYLDRPVDFQRARPLLNEALSQRLTAKHPSFTPPRFNPDYRRPRPIPRNYQASAPPAALHQAYNRYGEPTQETAAV